MEGRVAIIFFFLSWEIFQTCEVVRSMSENNIIDSSSSISKSFHVNGFHSQDISLLREKKIRKQELL